MVTNTELRRRADRVRQLEADLMTARHRRDQAIMRAVIFDGRQRQEVAGVVGMTKAMAGRIVGQQLETYGPLVRYKKGT